MNIELCYFLYNLGFAAWIYYDSFYHNLNRPAWAILTIIFGFIAVPEYFLKTRENNENYINFLKYFGFWQIGFILFSIVISGGTILKTIDSVSILKLGAIFVVIVLFYIIPKSLINKSNSRILPTDFPSSEENIYAGFWRRFGAFLIDFLITTPIILGLIYINNLDRMNALYTYIPTQIFFLIYYIYFVKLWGGTPGKLITKIKIVRKDGKPVRWREAILRHAIQWALGLPMGIVVLMPLLGMTDSEFLAVGAVERMKQTMEVAPDWYKFTNWMNQIWIWSEFIVLLFNKRKRALHDYVAGTVVIKKRLETTAEQLATVPPELPC